MEIKNCGPVSRSMALAEYLKSAGHDVATCLAEDVNYKETAGITNYFLDIPMPLGAPKIVGKHIFPIVQKLGITSKKRVRSFDEVLFPPGMNMRPGSNCPCCLIPTWKHSWLKYI